MKRLGNNEKERFSRGPFPKKMEKIYPNEFLELSLISDLDSVEIMCLLDCTQLLQPYLYNG